MIGRFVLRSTLATAVILFATGAANASCVIDDFSARPTRPLPTMDDGQEFSFIASGACRTLIFSVDGTTLTKIPTAGPGPATDRTYRVFLTESEWDSVVDPHDRTFTWSITAYGPDGRPIAEMTTTNELDSDDDGWTRSDGDVGECDHSKGINPRRDESCNNVDDNCNGRVDENLSYRHWSGFTPTVGVWLVYVCHDGVWEYDRSVR